MIGDLPIDVCRVSDTIDTTNQPGQDTMDTSHLVAVHERLFHERSRLECAKTAQEVEIRSVWVKQLEREFENELKFLGMSAEVDDIDDDELLGLLSA